VVDDLHDVVMVAPASSGEWREVPGATRSSSLASHQAERASSTFENSTPHGAHQRIGGPTRSLTSPARLSSYA
jgi:hypothetical protein